MISNVGALGGVKNKEEVKSFFEHVGLYVGLIVYTAAGAKVKSIITGGKLLVIKSTNFSNLE